MKRVALLLFIAGWLTPLALAQDHFQVGAYADYFHLSQTNSDMAGLGGRVGVRVFPYVTLEGEMNYDFNKVFTESFTNGGPAIVGAQQTDFRVIHGLFGPKIEGGHGRIRPFVTLKGGFVNFRLDPRDPSFATFISSVQNLRSNNVSGALYPGGGLEGHLGPIGLRLEAGDEIYFAGGTHHNARVTFGPFIRF
jgi:hypothetical protein